MDVHVHLDKSSRMLYLTVMSNAQQIRVIWDRSGEWDTSDIELPKVVDYPDVSCDAEVADALYDQYFFEVAAWKLISADA
jgi:hypothetical protein